MVRFEGNVVLNLDNLGSPDEAAAPEPVAPSVNQPANPPAKTRAVSGKPANPK